MRLVAAFAAILVGGCGGGTPPITALEFLEQCVSLKGKQVAVSGYLDICGGYECHLSTGKPGSDRWIATPDGRTSIGIGGNNEAFDRKAARLQSSYVVITGQVDDHSCDGNGGTDRSAGIHPIDIRASTADEAAPAKLVVEQ